MGHRYSTVDPCTHGVGATVADGANQLPRRMWERPSRVTGLRASGTARWSELAVWYVLLIGDSILLVLDFYGTGC